MSNPITKRVPESRYVRVKKLDKDDGVSLNRYVQMVLTEKPTDNIVVEVFVGGQEQHNDLRLTSRLTGQKTGAHTCRIESGLV